MTILIINNYYKKRNLNKVDQIVGALEQVGETEHVIWGFSEIDNKKIPDNVEAVILSGSAAHLESQVEGPNYTAEIDFLKKIQVPILGICFGHQLIAKAFGSKIESLKHPMTDFQKVTIVEPDEIFSSWKTGDEILVCQNHQDYVANIPEGFIYLAVSHTQSRKIVEGMKHKIKPIYGVQAHIERATDQHPGGRLLLKNFIANVVERIKAREFKKKVEESEEGYGVSDCIYNECIEEIDCVELSQLEEKHEMRIFRPFLLTWGAMLRVLGYAGVTAVRLKLMSLNEKISILRHKNLLSDDIEDLKNLIISLFDELRETEFKNRKGKLKKVGATTASKVLHLICPDLFVMWDSAIRAEYHKTEGDGEEYHDFLTKMKERLEEMETTIQELQQKYGKKPTRIIDQYNWTKAHG